MRAIELAVNRVGGQSALAREMGVSPQAVWKWLKAGRAPIGRVLDIERATGGEVTRYALRPDIYGDIAKQTQAGPWAGDIPGVSSSGGD